jgi:hypothetical protein
MMNGSSKVCYMCCFWLGDRRSITDKYRNDRLSYLKQQIEDLNTYNHNLSRIMFIFNLEDEHLGLFEEAKSIIPEYIKGIPVTIIPRQNIGMSYGAWSYAFGIFRNDYDYFIFNEDDYFINQHNFDSYFINKFESKINIGYLCLLVANPIWGGDYKTHAANSVGISSNKVLNEIWCKYGCLPHYNSGPNVVDDYYRNNEINGQIAQTNTIHRMGYNLFDVRDDYAVPHDTGMRPDIDFEHIVEIYFHYNNDFLFIPAVMKFKEYYFYVNIIDTQFKNKSKKCYIINFYFGNRKNAIEEYNIDRLCYLKKQIETLTNYSHNLDKIVFNINVDKEDYIYLNEAINLIPKNILNAVVDINIRENVGFSYGAFSDLFYKYRNDFDYFIFNVDDYFLVQNNWDEYLLIKYNELPNTGYLTPIVRDAEEWNDYKIHAGHCFGIASTENLNKVWDKYKCLPNSKENSYIIQERVQIDFTNAFIQLGMNIYDIREEYRIGFAMTDGTADIWRLWWWNEKDLIIPAIFAFDKPYSWWESYDDSFTRKTNL